MHQCVLNKMVAAQATATSNALTRNYRMTRNNGRSNGRTVPASLLIHASTAVLRYGPEPSEMRKCTAVAVYSMVGTPMRN
jgi:hypothetical protein